MTKNSKIWAGVFVVGVVAAGAYLAYQSRLEDSTTVEQITGASEVQPVETPARPVRRAPSATAAADRMDESPVTAMRVNEAVKPLLRSGTDMSMAAEGFDSQQQFVATAYAAKNLEVPFVLLKDRVTAQGRSLEAAIEELKPEANAKLEANRATAEAKAELARLRGE